MAKGKIAMNKVVFFLLVLCCPVRVTYSGFGFYRKNAGRCGLVQVRMKLLEMYCKICYYYFVKHEQMKSG